MNSVVKTIYGEEARALTHTVGRKGTFSIDVRYVEGRMVAELTLRSGA